jgi:hypothetical protein
MAINKKFKRELINALAQGIAYRYDFKKKQDKWSMAEIGKYGMSALDIVEEYLEPIIERHFSNSKGASHSLNKDLTATQQVASPKSASQTSLNPNIRRK